MFASIYTCFPSLSMTGEGRGLWPWLFPFTSAGPGPTSVALKFYIFSAEIAIPLRLMLIPVFHNGWPVNDERHEPLNTSGTLELLFPISKKEFVLVLFQFQKMIVFNVLFRSKIHHSCFLLISKMFCSKFIVVSFHNESFIHGIAASLCCVYIQHIT